jgi:hypothetical protein
MKLIKELGLGDPAGRVVCPLEDVIVTGSGSPGEKKY